MKQSSVRCFAYFISITNLLHNQRVSNCEVLCKGVDSIEINNLSVEIITRFPRQPDTWFITSLIIHTLSKMIHEIACKLQLPWGLNILVNYQSHSWRSFINQVTKRLLIRMCINKEVSMHHKAPEMWDFYRWATTNYFSIAQEQLYEAVKAISPRPLPISVLHFKGCNL